MIDDVVKLSSLVHYETVILKKYQIGSEKKSGIFFSKILPTKHNDQEN